jgi:hypothetical protein
MNSRRCKPKDHAEYSRSKPCIAAKAARSCPVGGQTRSFADVGSMSGLPESGHGFMSARISDHSRRQLFANAAIAGRLVAVCRRAILMMPERRASTTTSLPPARRWTS